MRIAYYIVLFGLASCTPFPTLDDNLTDAARAAPYPDLTPLPPQLDPSQADNASAQLADRVSALNARADRLRETDITTLQ